ncbi:flavodoxin family protein [Desulfosporosinus sp. OT]|uniref:flavodoxin family protein n=1 Tax=Desulfosporosinus sp. OT TaxID=913865 RepID=UPI00058D5C84|nr:flavodoxin family protein [Desulfosporosinus sp. OT]
MRILILNGNPKADYVEFDSYIEDLKQSLEYKSHKVKNIMLRNLQLHDCIGCYTCWLKTPGVCCFNDGIEDILKEYLAADVVILSSPIIMYYVSALLKRVNDRLLPLGHPFLVLRDHRMSHVQRYNRYPKTTLLLDNQKEFDRESFQLIELVYKKSVRGLAKIWSTKQNVEEITDEVVNI